MCVIKTFAPVAIPTLCRYEHFKRCLESLERCSWAEHTDIYVGLDYPPADKYKEGWMKINSYLQDKEKQHGFKSLHVRRRKENCGVGRAGSNVALLRAELQDKYENYILTEDDNEFSPCFLEFMNQNLEKYKDDPAIFRVCGYLPKQHSFTEEYSQFIADRYVAWGVGIWRSKQKDYNRFCTPEGVQDILNDKKVRKYFEEDHLENILESLISMSKGGSMLEDVVVCSYMVHKNLRCILPTKSMVRNLGWDGSGLHGGYVAGYAEQEIQTRSTYSMKEAPEQFTVEFEKEMHQSRRIAKRNANSMKSFITWYLYKYTGIFCQFKTAHKLGKKLKYMLRF